LAQQVLASMPTHRAIKGLLQNFLDTYSSRYSDHGGYWIFGLIVNDLNQLEIDLLANKVSPAATPLAAAEVLAIERFQKQAEKATFRLSSFSEARLTIAKLPEIVEDLAGSSRCAGYRLSLKATAVSERGRAYEREKLVFVAPHDPRRELRRRPAT
jgi:hypothetical protein